MQKLIIDTNILQYGVNDSYADQIAALLEDLLDTYSEMYISAYTTFEIYRGIDNGKIAKTKNVVDLFTSVPPDLVTFKIAAVLTTCYQRHESTKAFASKYSDGDTLIAASAVRDEAKVLTVNSNDFPAPFFREEVRYYIENAKTHVKLPVSVMATDYEMYFAARDQHYPKK